MEAMLGVWWAQHIDALVPLAGALVAVAYASGLLRLKRRDPFASSGRQQRKRLGWIAVVLVAVAAISYVRDARRAISSPRQGDGRVLVQDAPATSQAPKWLPLGDDAFHLLLPPSPAYNEYFQDSEHVTVKTRVWSGGNELSEGSYTLRITERVDGRIPADPQAVLQSTLRHSAMVPGAKLVAQTEATIGGRRGLRAEYETEHFAIRTEGVWVGPREYNLIRVIANGLTPSDTRFFGSFIILSD